MPSAELTPRSFAAFMLDEAGGSWSEFALLASLVAVVFMLAVLVLRKEH